MISTSVNMARKRVYFDELWYAYSWYFLFFYKTYKYNQGPTQLMVPIELAP